MRTAASGTSPPTCARSTWRTFDAKAPPPKTQAFWRIVHSNAAPEDAGLADVLEALDRPKVITLRDLADAATNRGMSELAVFLTSLKTRRISAASVEGRRVRGAVQPRQERWAVEAWHAPPGRLRRTRYAIPGGRGGTAQARNRAVMDSDGSDFSIVTTKRIFL